MLSVLDPIRKAGGGGGGGCAVRFGPDTKSGGGGGGGGGPVRFTPDAKSGWERAVLSASGPIRRKVGGGGGGGRAACRTMIFVCARVRDST